MEMTPYPIEDVVAMMGSDDVEQAQIGMAGCHARIEESAPLLRVYIDAYAGGALADDAELWIILRGLHVLAAVRDATTFSPLLRILEQPTDALDKLFGDCITETVSKIVASVFDGDSPVLFQAILRPETDPFSRGALLGAAITLTYSGRIERSTMMAFLSAFARYPDWEDIEWSNWMEAVALLGLTELRPLAVQMFETGVVSNEIYDISWLDETLQTAKLYPNDFKPFEHCSLGYIDDPIGALAWLDTPYQPFTAPSLDAWRKPGRNDPCPCGSGRKFKKCCIEAV